MTIPLPLVSKLPLDQKENSRLYWELARRGAVSWGEKFSWKYQKLTEEELMILALAQSRYDPRLFGVLVEFFRTRSPELHPVRFKEQLTKAELLPAAAVLGEFVVDSEAPEVNRDMFRYLMSIAKPATLQLFYKGLYPLGSRKMEEAVSKPLWPFKKWGFLATDPPAKSSYLFDLPARRQILNEIVRSQGRFRMSDYLKAVHHSVSRQQALKDVRSFPGIKKKGQGKGSVYFAGKGRASP